MNPQQVDVDSLVQRLLEEDAVQIGDCALYRNRICDCILGTDPLGVDAVAAFTASAEGCRDAVAWAMRANRIDQPRKPH